MTTSTDTKELTIQRDTTMVGAKAVQVLRCSGYVDTNTYQNFQTAITAPLEQHQMHLVLDMQGITYINSTGFGLLLSTHRQAETGGGKLVVAGLPAKVANIFSLLGFDHIIQTFPSVDEALSAFS